MVIKTSFIIAGTVFGLTSIGSVGACLITTTTAEKYLEDELLDENSTEDWKELQKKLNTYEDIGKYMDASLQAIKKEDSSNGESYEEGIKSWCNKNKNTKINPRISFLPWSNQLLLEAINNFCIRTMGEKLSNKIDLNNQEKFKQKFQKIKSHDTNHGILDAELKKIENESEDIGWEKLRNWCAKTNQKGYNKKRENLWKLTQNYCSD